MCLLELLEVITFKFKYKCVINIYSRTILLNGVLYDYGLQLNRHSIYYTHLSTFIEEEAMLRLLSKNNNIEKKSQTGYKNFRRSEAQSKVPADHNFVVYFVSNCTKYVFDLGGGGYIVFGKYVIFIHKTIFNSD